MRDSSHCSFGVTRDSIPLSMDRSILASLSLPSSSNGGRAMNQTTTIIRCFLRPPPHPHHRDDSSSQVIRQAKAQTELRSNLASLCMQFPIHPLPLLDVLVPCDEPRFACDPHRSKTFVVILFVQLFRLNPSGNSKANRRCIVKK
jgi:hypothetical protein